MRQCAKVTLIATCKTLRVVYFTTQSVLPFTLLSWLPLIIYSNCNDCKLFICTNNRPLMLGSNLQIGLAPYNTTYPTLIHHLRQSRININNNFWDKPFIVSDTRFCAQQPSVYLLPTAEYSRFCIPFDFTDAGNTERATLVVPLPSAYSEALHQEEEQANEAIQRIMQMEEMSADSTRHIQKCFQEWLAQSRKLREICDLCHLESTPNQPNTSDS
ncbi:TBCC domain-containing protein 1 [Pelomyxa schiedti]|nr:TBCC domain-containing protein 1 [Pelomyxa schiedti]